MFVVDADMEGIVLCLSGSDTLPIAYGRRLLEHSQTTQLVILAGRDIETLQQLGAIVLIPAIESL